MKAPIKIIQYRDGSYGAKRRGWFGWTYLNEIYDGNWCWHYAWCYWVPGGGCYDKFKTKREVIVALRDYYHGSRLLREAL